MKLVIAFLRLIRWPNLIFIVLTQCLFYYCITIPVFRQNNVSPFLNEKSLWLIIIASLCIAAAGYIINDYFDLNIDRVNKPDKLIIDRSIKRRGAILWHLALSFAGVLISVCVAFRMGDWHVYLAAFINFICVITLWFYSTTYKRKLMVGNIIISLLTAWTILVLYLSQVHNWFWVKSIDKVNYQLATTRLFKYAILYAGFAFIISLIREVIKDMEDIEGDAKYNCKTMPVVWGIKATKVFVAVWIIVLIGALVILQFYVLQFGWWPAIIYCMILLIAPLLWIMKKLHKAQVPAQYHQLSSMVKFVMLAGILSMLFFKVYSW